MGVEGWNFPIQIPLNRGHGVAGSGKSFADGGDDRKYEPEAETVFRFKVYLLANTVSAVIQFAESGNVETYLFRILLSFSCNVSTKRYDFNSSTTPDRSQDIIMHQF